MRRPLLALLLVVCALILAPIPGSRPQSDAVWASAGHATKHCKTVKKKVHGKTKKVKVCTTVKPKPTPTPTNTPLPTATPTPLPATISVSMAPPTAGFTFTESNGAYRFDDPTYGDALEISQVTISKYVYDATKYTVSMYVKATKSASGMDTALHSDWSLPSTSITLVAVSNHHPYLFGNFLCPDIATELPNDDLYNGESAQGWVCATVEGQNAAGNYTVTWQPDIIYQGLTTATILNAKITVPGS